MKRALLLLVIGPLIGCSTVGKRDMNYVGSGTANANIIAARHDWWQATVMLRTTNGSAWCSGVCIANTTENNLPVVLIVTARHCSTKTATASEVYYDNLGNVTSETKHVITRVINHPNKDFALLIASGHAAVIVKPYNGVLPSNRQDFIIGYRGDSHRDFYKLGKFISPAYAYSGQSGGGVFSTNFGLHSIVSTHIDGVNIATALKELNITY